MHARRIYLKKIFLSNQIPLDTEQTHYIRRVLRLSSGDHVRVFNPQSGEWLATVDTTDSKATRLLPKKCLRPPATSTPAIHLFFGLLKKPALELLVQKATEVGVTHLYPCITQHTIAKAINIQRLSKIIIEATEQSERLDPPTLSQVLPLNKALKTELGFETQKIFLTLEGSSQLKDQMTQWSPTQPVAFFIGPEGGWSDLEEKQLQQIVQPLTLTTTTLRAETASILAIGLWKSFQN